MKMNQDATDAVMSHPLHPASPGAIASKKRKVECHDETTSTPLFSSSSSRVSFLGKIPSDRMCVISPPTSDSHRPPDFSAAVLNGLEKVEKIFKQRKTKRCLAKVANDDRIQECRLIQGNRYEIFVQSKKYSSFIWYKILEQGGFENSELFTRDLIHFAVARARQDPRVGQNANDWNFENFSLIVTYSKVSEQEPHIDLLLPNFQFGMVVSDASPSTWYYEVPDDERIANGKQLADLWTKLDSSITDQLRSILEECPDINNKLESFGAVLGVSVPSESTSNLQDQELKRPFFKHEIANVQRGTVLSLPGSQVHGGPSTEMLFRAVLFFSGHPGPADIYDDAKAEDAKSIKRRSNQEEGYDPDTQYSNVLLMTSILQILWRRYQVTEATRIYLLKRLRMYMMIARSKGKPKDTSQWHHHFYEQVELKAMLELMEARIIREETNRRVNSLFSLKPSWDEFYKEHAKDVNISSLHLETTEYVGEFRLVSAKGLHLEYNGAYLPASLFQRDVDNRILIYYWHSNEWEGSKDSDHYKIEWNEWSSPDKPGKRIMFDGRKGVLLDSDGDRITAKVIEGDCHPGVFSDEKETSH